MTFTRVVFTERNTILKNDHERLFAFNRGGDRVTTRDQAELHLGVVSDGIYETLGIALNLHT